MDVFFWNYLKETVFRKKLASLDELPRKRLEESHQIPAEILGNILQEFENRIFVCMHENGDHFKHFR